MNTSENIITLRHYLVLFVISFSFGILTANFAGSFAVFAVVFFVILLIAAATAIFVIIPIFKHKFCGIRKSFLLPIVLAAAFLAGIFRMFCVQTLPYAGFENFENKSGWVTGTVSTVPTLTSSGFYYYFELDAEEITVNSVTTPINGKIMMYITPYKGKYIEFGTQINCWTDLETYSDADIAANYNYYANLRGKNIFVIGKTSNFHLLSRRLPLTPSYIIKKFGIYVHNKISDTADILFGYDTEALALFKGILIGDKTDFSDTLYSSLANAGLSHITAVSGMHMSFLFSAFTFLLMKLRLKRRSVLLLSVPVILLFTATAAFSPSVCRAAIMLSVMIASALSGERYEPVNSLFLALGVILLVSPYSLFLPSLLLSFGATLGIIAYYKFIKAILVHICGSGLVSNYLSDSLALSLSSFIGTAYFSALFFGSISKSQFLTNLWIIPLVAFVFCLGYAACIIHCFIPAIAFRLLRYPIAGALEVILVSGRYFGREKFISEISIGTFPVRPGIIYLGAALILYYLLKLVCDSGKLGKTGIISRLIHKKDTKFNLFGK